jgi:hypothetical protein
MKMRQKQKEKLNEPNELIKIAEINPAIAVQRTKLFFTGIF